MSGPRVLLPEGRRASREPVRFALRLVLLATAAALGVAVGLADLRSGDTLFTAALIGIIALAFAAIRPANALLHGLVVALGVPAVYLWATFADKPIPFPPTPNLAATLLAIVPAILGTLAGLFLRFLVTGSPRRRRSRS
jgi:hypothetical protein